jgi:hypothetical protein
MREDPEMQHREVPLVLLVAALLLGCRDKGRESLQQCVKLSDEGKTEEALKACESAVVHDPNGPSGKSATEKIAELTAKIEKAEAEARQEAEAEKQKAEQERVAKEREAAKKPAGDVLNSQPELLSYLPTDKFGNIVAFLKGPHETIDRFNCPALDDIKEKEPFAKREAEDKAREICRTEIKKAMDEAGVIAGHLKSCPFVRRFQVVLHEYQLDAAMFPIWTVGTQRVIARSGKRGQAVVDHWLLSWPDAHPFPESRFFKNAPTSSNYSGFDYLPAAIKSTGEPPCSGSPSEVVPVMSALTLELRLPEDQAKELSKVIAATPKAGDIDTFVEVAMTVTGEPPREAELACGEKQFRTIPANALAWRTVHLKDLHDKEPTRVLTPWITAQRWDPPKSCEELKSLLAPSGGTTKR